MLKNISEIKPNPQNPRVIEGHKFELLVKSILAFPEMLELRPIVVDENLQVLGGNMRLKACKEAGLEQVHISIAEGLTEEQKKEFIIKDNVGFGEWDWELLSSDAMWNELNLSEWGLELGADLDSGDFGEDFSLDDGDKEPYQQMTFTLADEQAKEIKAAIEKIKKTEEYKYCETFGNENGNGNALYLICRNG
jgi:hypothetical protein